MSIFGWFKVINRKEAFYSIEIDEQHKHKTAFEFKNTAYDFNGMIMGYKNSLQILQRMIAYVLSDYIRKEVEVYKDDIIIHAKSRNEHDVTVIDVIKKQHKNNFRINIEKLQVAQQEVLSLGVKLNGEEIKLLEEQKNKINNSMVPKSIKDMRAWIGGVNWSRGYIERFADKTIALTNSLKVKEDKMWVWTKQMEIEFNNLKEISAT